MKIPIKAVENAGYLNIYYEDGEFHIELYAGVQSFKLDYSNEEYESARWMAKQFAHALNGMVGDVRLYGTEMSISEIEDKIAAEMSRESRQ